MTSLLLITLGPVQDFIISACRTPDIAFGSWFLSELARAAVHEILAHDGFLIFLQEALEQPGIGAKASSGYGRMTLLDTLTKPLAQSVVNSRFELPSCRVGQAIQGVVIAPTESMLHIESADAKAFINYLQCPLKHVFIIFTPPNASSWIPGNMRNCLFQ